VQESNLLTPEALYAERLPAMPALAAGRLAAMLDEHRGQGNAVNA
jgi:hypothetical protein